MMGVEGWREGGVFPTLSGPPFSSSPVLEGKNGMRSGVCVFVVGGEKQGEHWIWKDERGQVI